MAQNFKSLFGLCISHCIFCFIKWIAYPIINTHYNWGSNDAVWESDYGCDQFLWSVGAKREREGDDGGRKTRVSPFILGCPLLYYYINVTLYLTPYDKWHLPTL